MITRSMVIRATREFAYVSLSSFDSYVSELVTVLSSDDVLLLQISENFKRNRSTIISIRIPDTLAKKLDEIAAKVGCSRGRVIRGIILMFLKEAMKHGS